MSVFNYYSNPVPTTTVYEENAYRSRPGQSRTVFHHTKEGPFVAVIGMPMSVIVEHTEAAAPAVFGGEEELWNVMTPPPQELVVSAWI
jgi:hypothetical protein